MSPPWLSILVPVFGVAPFLDACAASILEQADDGVEVVFVDDASRDGEAAMLEAWQGRFPERVRIVTHDQNRGIAGTRNTLLENARGDYLWFVDSDDQMAPGAIAGLRRVLAGQRPDLVMCDFRILREFDDAAADAAASSKRNRKRARDAHVRSFDGASGAVSTSRDALVNGLFSKGYFHPWSKIVRRAAWPADLRFPDGRVFEDLAVYARLALAMRSFVHVPEVWIVYRQHSGSILNTPSPRKLDDWMAALAGFGPQVRDAGSDIRAQTRFAVAGFATREWRMAVRALRKLPGADVGATLRRFHAAWAASTPLDAGELAWAYLRRGQVRKWWQMRGLVREAGR